MSKNFAVIGGTGLTRLNDFAVLEQHCIDTPYGKTSANIIEGVFKTNAQSQDYGRQGEHCYFLARHGHPHRIPPHKINYRANIWALQQLGVNNIVAVNAVGGIHVGLDAGSLCIPDQIIDYTYRRETSFFDGAEDIGMPRHIDFTEPFSPALRNKILSAGASLSLNVADRACYACVEGPRLETAAEINRLEKDGCDIVGMTGMPEAALARELGIDYASLCLVVNKAAGRGSDVITIEAIEQTLKEGMGKVYSILNKLC